MTTLTDSLTLSDLLANGGVRSVYQPIVHLASGEVVAYEALVRGPQGSPLESPGALFAAADREGLTAELEDAAVERALTGAIEADLGIRIALFVNIEGDQVARLRSATLGALLARAVGRLRLVFEVTERNLLARPDELLARGEDLRAQGWGLAIDDVGAKHAEGIAALPFVRPDIVKMDLALIQEPRMSMAAAEISLAVRQHVERFGGGVVAEGIETEAHLDRARTLGADLGQGWLLGRPGPLPERSRRTRPMFPIRELAHLAGPEDAPPSVVVGSRRDLQVTSKQELLAISRAFESRALGEAPHVAIFGLMQTLDNYTPRTRRRYESLAEGGAMVSVFGTGMQDLTAGVRGVELAPDDLLVHEWSVIVWGAGYHGALVARDLGDDDVPDMDRRFTYAITHDADLVLELGRGLMTRLPFRAR